VRTELGYGEALCRWLGYVLWISHFKTNRIEKGYHPSMSYSRLRTILHDDSTDGLKTFISPEETTVVENSLNENYSDCDFGEASTYSSSVSKNDESTRKSRCPSSSSKNDRSREKRFTPYLSPIERCRNSQFTILSSGDNSHTISINEKLPHPVQKRKYHKPTELSGDFEQSHLNIISSTDQESIIDCANKQSISYLDTPKKLSSVDLCPGSTNCAIQNIKSSYDSPVHDYSGQDSTILQSGCYGWNQYLLDQQDNYPDQKLSENTLITNVQNSDEDPDFHTESADSWVEDAGLG